MKENKFEDLMSAITFAEAGESEKAREFLKGSKRILIAISERMFDVNALKYGLNISKRIGADIDILYLSGSDMKNPYLEEFISEVRKEKIKCDVVRRDGCMKKVILDYTEMRREILFVVIGSTPELDVECKTGEKVLSEWKKLKCPLVVVSKGEMLSMA